VKSAFLLQKVAFYQLLLFRLLYLTTHNTQHTLDRDPSPRRDPNPQSQEASGCRHMP